MNRRPRAPRLGRSPRPPHPTAPATLTPLELALAAAIGLLLLGSLLLWASAWLLTGGQLATPPAELPRVVGRLLNHPGEPAAAWPADRHRLPGPIAFYAATTALAALPAAATALLVSRAPHHGREHDAAWARRRDLAPLRVTKPGGGRVVLGHHHPSGTLLATEPARSLLVLGPSRSGKTTGLAIPAILEWDGPVIATSVKTDLVRDTAGWRHTKGQVWLYDPTNTTGLPTAGWSPLHGCGTWMGAVRTAHAMATTTREGGTAGGLTDGDFWYASAAKLLAPLLFAAATHRRPISDVVRWINTHEQHEVQRLLTKAGVVQAIEAFTASTRRADNQRSSIYTTAETVLAAYEDPLVAASAATTPAIDPAQLLAGDHTVYLCAPRDDQRRLRPLFVGLLHQLLATAARTAATTPTGTLPRPLLVVLDEAANIAPLPDLDEIASTAMGLGITLVTVWQDLAQIRSRYGPRAPTIVNNHAGQLILRGIRDLEALTTFEALIGRSTPPPTHQAHPTDRLPPAEPLFPAHSIRALPDGRAIALYQHLPPFQLTLRPHHQDRHLRRRALWPPPASPKPPPDDADEVSLRPASSVQEVHDASGRAAGSSPVDFFAHACAHAAELAALAADEGASNLRILPTKGGRSPNELTVLVDLPPQRRLLHIAAMTEQFSELLDLPVDVRTPDMLPDPAAAEQATPLASLQEAPPDG